MYPLFSMTWEVTEQAVSISLPLQRVTTAFQREFVAVFMPSATSELLLENTGICPLIAAPEVLVSDLDVVE